jgi:hypothetical protein
VVLRCLAKPPADRFSSMTALATALGKLLAGLPVEPVILPPRRAPTDTSAPTAVLSGSASANGPSDPTTLRVSSGEIRTIDRSVRRRRLWLAASVLAGAVGATTALVIASLVEAPAHVAATVEPRSAPPSRVEPPNEPSAQPSAAAPMPVESAPPAPSVASGNDAPPTEAPAPAPTEATAAVADKPPPRASDEAAAPSPVTKRPRATPSSRIMDHGKKHPGATVASASKPIAADRNAVVGKPVSGSSPSPPITEPPPAPAPVAAASSPAPPAANKCTTSSFAMIYNERSLSKDMLGKAFHTLEACKAAGDISDADYKRTKDVLVARWANL